MDLSQGFHDRLKRAPEQGEMRDGQIRYLMMRPDALMGMFMRLEPGLRQAALAALAASVAEFGGKSVSAYQASGAAQQDKLISVIVRTSADLGWGLWQFARLPDGAFELIVRNSPFATAVSGAEMPVCAPVVGILTAMAPLLVGEGAEVTETQCCARTGDVECRFLVRKPNI